MSDFNSLVQYTVENISRPVKYIIYKLTEFIRVVDKFVFRQVPIGAASGYATIEQIEGNTVAWNQLIQNGDFSDGTTGWSKRVANIMSVTDGVCSLIYKETTYNNQIFTIASIISGHKYYASVDVKRFTDSNRFLMVASNTYSNITIIIQTNVVGRNSVIWTSSANKTGVMVYSGYAGVVDSEAFAFTNLQFIDLTAIFGAGNEPTTVADFEAWMAQNIGTLPYYDYNAGELLSVKMSGMQTGRLPLGYQELEYLELTGTQYINTGITKYKNTNVLKLKIRCSAVTSTAFITFQNPSSDANNIGLYVSSSKLYYQYAALPRLSLSIVAGTEYVIEVGNGYLTINGNSRTGTIAEEFTVSRPLYIGAGTSADAIDSRRFGGRIYYYRYEDKDGNLLFNGIPAKDSNGVIGMYDTVSEQFFTNSGTGTFIGGPEVHLDTLPFDVTTFTGINPNTNTREIMFSSGMKQADREGTVKDTLDLLSDTATVNVGSRAYQSGDESDTSVITDGTTTYYALTTPIEYTDLQDANGNPLNPRYKVEQGGTEQVLPVNTSTPTTVAPTLTTTYTKDVH